MYGTLLIKKTIFGSNGYTQFTFMMNTGGNINLMQGVTGIGGGYVQLKTS